MEMKRIWGETFVLLSVDFICLFSLSSAVQPSLCLVAQRLKHLPGMQETRVRSLGQEDPLEKEMATHSSTVARRIPWREEPGGLQSMGSQRVRQDWATSLTHSLTAIRKPVLSSTLNPFPPRATKVVSLRSVTLFTDYLRWFVPLPLFGYYVSEPSLEN